jgi:hypothetical protein
MDALKNKISEKVADSALDFTKETVKEVVEEEKKNDENKSLSGINKPPDNSTLKNSDGSNVKQLDKAAKDVLENTKEYIDKNKDNIAVISKNMAGLASRVVEKAKEKLVDDYNEGRVAEIKKMEIKEEGKQIIIDATTGKEKNENGNSSMIIQNNNFDNDIIHKNFQDFENIFSKSTLGRFMARGSENSSSIEKKPQ